MSEMGGGDNDGMSTSGGGETTEASTGQSEASAGGTSVETGFDGETHTGNAGPAGIEVSGGKGAEGIAVTSSSGKSSETAGILGDTAETGLAPMELAQAQKEVEGFQQQSIAQILETNGKYMHPPKASGIPICG